MASHCNLTRIISSRFSIGTLFGILYFSLFQTEIAQAFPAKFGVSPDNNQSLLLSALKSAQKQLLINVYQVDCPAVVQEIISKISYGLEVSILIEGSPVGRVGAAENQALADIYSAMTKSGSDQQHLYIMKSGQASKRRYRFDHAKYVVIDGQQVFISSENFTTTGHPDQGLIGNRGWDTLLEDAGLASQLSDIFAIDTDPKYGDIFEYSASNLKMDATPTASSKDPLSSKKEKPRNVPSYPIASGNVDQVTLITSPNSLDGLVQLIRSTTTHLRLEEMSLPLNWRQDGSTNQSPLITEMIHAAERGVQVEVLLNDDRVFHSGPKEASEETPPTQHSLADRFLGQSRRKTPPSDDSDTSNLKGNALTVHFIQAYGTKNQLPLQARVVNIGAVDITYIHNKGMIMDDSSVLVSSINGTENSVMNNREVAILLAGQDAANYFSPIFDSDWEKSSDLVKVTASAADQPFFVF